MNPSQPIVQADRQHAVTTSLVVAEKFGKRHKNVLRDIETIIKKCPDEEFSRLNFEPRNYQYTTGKNQERDAEMYNLTRQGFTMLAMGFSGDKAFLWKIAFITAFDRMEQLLNQGLANEHHAMVEALFARHPQWRDTRDKYRAGLKTSQIAQLQGKHPRRVRGMAQCMEAAGVACRPYAVGAKNLLPLPPARLN